MSRAAERVLMDLTTCKSGGLGILRLQEESTSRLKFKILNFLLLRKTDGEKNYERGRVLESL